MPNEPTWREHFRPRIAKVITEVGTDDMPALRRALRDAFPAGERQYHPYKIWLHEIRVQLGLVKMWSRQREKAKQPCDGQQELF
jgi:hypothetical protein